MGQQIHSPKDFPDDSHRSEPDWATREDLKRAVNIIMSAIQDWAVKEQADLDGISATLDGIVTGVKSLDDKITALQNSPGTLSADDQAALDAIQTASKAVVAKAAGIQVA